MNVRCHVLAALPLLWLASGTTVRAQEVRRALPAGLPPAPRALPVLPGSGPSSSSILDQNINPGAPTPKPFRPEPTPTSAGSAAEPDPKSKDAQADDEIRLAPGSAASANSGDPAKAQLAIADGLYLRRMYDLAIPEYERYLGEFPVDPGRASAMYRLAECYSKLGQEVPALNTYRLLLDEVGRGEFVASAAFRLATHEFERRNYQDAAALFATACENAKSPEISVTARYYQAKCLEFLNRKAEAKAAYEDLLRTKDKNPYRDAASLSLAYFALEANRKPEAMALFDTLGHEAVKPTVRAEALTRAGIVASELKQRDQAERYFKEAMALNTTGKWNQVAQLEWMKLQYDGDKFSQVLDSYTKTAPSLNDETRPTVLLLVANSYRQLGKYPKAVEVYNQLLRQYPATTEAADARFQRLIALDALKDPNLVPEVDAYLSTGPARDRADKASLLKAQALVQQTRYQAAARIYLELGQSTLPENYRADCYYAAGYCLSQVNDTPGAIEAFSGLISRYPHYRMIVKALLKRALLYQTQRNYVAAAGDFDRVVDQTTPGAPERETALLEKGLTLGQQGKYADMSATFQQLLKEYPNSTGAAQANYWIGWAAFDNKRYADAIEPLSQARKLNPPEYGDRVALRLLYCAQVLNRPADAAREIDSFIQGDLKRVSVVADGCRWVGAQFYTAKNFAGTAKYLGLLAKSDEERPKIDPATWLMLGRAETEQKQFSDAIEALTAYLQSATEPADRAQAFLALGRAQLGAVQPDAAMKSAEQALSLQPEGRLNAEARMLIGDINAAKGDYNNAARSYLSVAVLYEDPEVTPHALEAAYQAFQKAGNQDQASKTLSELKNRYPAYEVRSSAS
ncbi:MAG: tetratricopeptide repeat protein [Verrucomicrobia bacterium]|nr:tetratricopeptide repeat protein [Verrucomicrobiota bacterium]